MGFFTKILDFIFGKPAIIQDPFFGKMTDADDYYECRRMFQPTGTILEIGLTKKTMLPDEKQINFFHWVEDNFDLIIEKISPALEKRIAAWLGDYEITNFKKEFVLEYLFIPKCDEAIIDWQISFYATNELKHWCTIEMKGLAVKSIMIDG